MQVALTRKDLQGAVDIAKNRIIERLISKYDLQSVSDSTRERIMSCLNDYYQQHQQQLRQLNLQTEQQARRSANLELKLVSMDQEIKGLRQLMARMLEAQKSLNLLMANIPNQLITSAARKEIETARLQPQYEEQY